MTPDLIGEAIVDLMILAGFLMVLGIGALIADHVIPRIPFVQRIIDSLPDYEDDEEIYRKEMARIRRQRNARKNRRKIK